MDKVYIVFGETGEYSDRREWLVSAFSSVDKAEQKVTDLEMLLRMLVRGRDPGDCGDEVLLTMREVDPGFCMDYAGTRYYAAACNWEG